MSSYCERLRNVCWCTPTVGWLEIPTQHPRGFVTSQWRNITKIVYNFHFNNENDKLKRQRILARAKYLSYFHFQLFRIPKQTTTDALCRANTKAEKEHGPGDREVPRNMPSYYHHRYRHQSEILWIHLRNMYCTRRLSRLRRPRYREHLTNYKPPRFIAETTANLLACESNRSFQIPLFSDS